MLRRKGGRSILRPAERHVELVHILGKVLQRNNGFVVVDQIKRVSHPDVERVANCRFAFLSRSPLKAPSERS